VGATVLVGSCGATTGALVPIELGGDVRPSPRWSVGVRFRGGLAGGVVLGAEIQRAIAGWARRGLVLGGAAGWALAYPGACNGGVDDYAYESGAQLDAIVGYRVPWPGGGVTLGVAGSLARLGNQGEAGVYLGGSGLRVAIDW
jgi:hypothetical protein